MKSSLLMLSALAVGVTEGKEVLETLFSYNCQGQAHIAPDALGGSAIDMSVVERMWGTYMGRVKERVSCHCPFVSHQVLEERFGLFQNFVDNLMNPNFVLTPDACLDNINDPTMDIAKLMKNVQFPLKVPVSGIETCPSPSLKTADGRCLFQIELPIVETQLQVAFLRCDSGRPAFSLHCGGKYCDVSKPCVSDSECEGTCLSVDSMFTMFDQSTQLKASDLFAAGLSSIGLSLSSCGVSAVDVVTNVFRRMTNNQQAVGFCIPKLLSLGNFAQHIGEFAIGQESEFGSCADELTKLYSPKPVTYTINKQYIKSWDGALSSGEDALYNLEVSPYPKVSSLPLGTLGATYNCKDELLIPFFGIRTGYSLILQALAEEGQALWKCQGQNPIFFEYNEMIWNPGFWTAAFSDFQDGVYAKDLCTLASQYIGAFADACPKMGSGGGGGSADDASTMSGFPYKLLAPTSSMGFLSWSTKRMMSLLWNVPKVAGNDAQVKGWVEECKSHPMGLPSVTAILDGSLAKAMSMKDGCNSNSDCPSDMMCTPMTELFGSMDFTASFLWQYYDVNGCAKKSADYENEELTGFKPKGHEKCASTESFVEDLLIVDPFNGGKKHEALQRIKKAGYQICIPNIQSTSDPDFIHPTAAGMTLNGLEALNELNPLRND